MRRTHWAVQIACTMAIATLSTTTIPAFANTARTVIIAPSEENTAGNVGVSPITGLPDVSASSVNANNGLLAQSAKSACVMDYATGSVLYEKDAHKRLPMASITKIMTMLLIMEALDDGKIKLDDPIKTSDYAASMGGSQIFLEPGETMTVKDMMKGIAVASANDACVAMAEHLCGTEAAFVAKMNEKAKALGMDDTHFANCNGLPADNHYSSAHDIAIMSRALLEHKEITNWTSIYSDYLRKDTDRPLWLVNTNKLVRFYNGVDGLKTGYTSEAKYCLSATAKKPDGFRVIAVVMGEPKPATRNAEVSGLLNWSFSQFESKVLFERGQTVVKDAPISRGKSKTVEAVAGDLVGIVQPRGTRITYTPKIELYHTTAPVLAGQRIGTIRVLKEDKVVAEAPILAKNAVEKASLWDIIGRVITFNTK